MPGRIYCVTRKLFIVLFVFLVIQAISVRTQGVNDHKAYAGVLKKFKQKMKEEVYEYKKTYIVEQFNNLLRAMFAVIVQKNHIKYLEDEREGHLYGYFIHFPVEIEKEKVNKGEKHKEKYIVNAWLYRRGPPIEEMDRSKEEEINRFKMMRFVEFNVFLQKPGDNNPEHRIPLLVVGVDGDVTYDANSWEHNADVYGYRLSKGWQFWKEKYFRYLYKVAQNIPHVIKLINKKYHIHFNPFHYWKDSPYRDY